MSSPVEESQTTDYYLQGVSNPSLGRGRLIAWAVITGLAVGVLLAAGATLLACGVLTGSLPFMIAGGAVVALSGLPFIMMIFLSVRAQKMGSNHVNKVGCSIAKYQAKNYVRQPIKPEEIMTFGEWTIYQIKDNSDNSFRKLQEEWEAKKGGATVFDWARCIIEDLEKMQEFFNLLNDNDKTIPEEEVIQIAEVIHSIYELFMKLENKTNNCGLIKDFKNSISNIKNNFFSSTRFKDIYKNLSADHLLLQPECFLHPSFEILV